MPHGGRSHQLHDAAITDLWGDHMYTIETGIPIPNIARSSGYGKRKPQEGSLSSFMRLLEVGQSFVVANRPAASVTALCSLVGRATGRRYISRKTEKGIRVWRVE